MSKRSRILAIACSIMVTGIACAIMVGPSVAEPVTGVSTVDAIAVGGVADAGNAVAMLALEASIGGPTRPYASPYDELKRKLRTVGPLDHSTIIP